jgi:DNA-binding response OmpR family regulator
MPTAFGTGCSFNQQRKPGDPIIIWIRHDKDVAEIVEAIITSLTRADIYEKLGGLWQESEIIVDWLMKFSPLSKLLPQAPTTIKATRTVQNATLLTESEKFMRRIGAPIISLSQVNTSLFSESEKELYELLRSKSPNVVTFDELSKADPNNFSLYAVSKSIQRLRDKLEKSGVSGSYIQTKRGEGYLLIT